MKKILIPLLVLTAGCASTLPPANDLSETEKRQQNAETAKWKEIFNHQIEQRGEDVRVCGDKFPDAYKSYAKNVVRIEFFVGPDGVGHKMRVIQNTTGSQGLQECLLQAFKNSKFNPLPKHLTSISVSYPFNFKAGTQTIQ